MSFQNLCKIGNLTNIQRFIQQNKNKHVNWDDGLWGACLGGHLPIAQLMIQKGANDWNGGLSHACHGGYLPIAQLMIRKGADDWNWGLYEACHGGHLSLAELVIQKGANDWNRGLCGACCGGHLQIALCMIQKGANDWNRGLCGACCGGHLSVVRLMIQKGATNISGWYKYPKNHASILYLFEHNILKTQLLNIPRVQTFFTLVARRQAKIKQLLVLLRDISCIISSYALL